MRARERPPGCRAVRPRRARREGICVVGTFRSISFESRSRDRTPDGNQTLEGGAMFRVVLGTGSVRAERSGHLGNEDPGEVTSLVAVQVDATADAGHRSA